jgi:hypothetical protein
MQLHPTVSKQRSGFSKRCLPDSGERGLDLHFKCLLSGRFVLAAGIGQWGGRRCQQMGRRQGWCAAAGGAAGAGEVAVVASMLLT